MRAILILFCINSITLIIMCFNLSTTYRYGAVNTCVDIWTNIYNGSEDPAAIRESCKELYK